MHDLDFCFDGHLEQEGLLYFTAWEVENTCGSPSIIFMSLESHLRCVRLFSLDPFTKVMMTLRPSIHFMRVPPLRCKSWCVATKTRHSIRVIVQYNFYYKSDILSPNIKGNLSEPSL